MTRLKTAAASLEALSVGDALGEMFAYKPDALRPNHQNGTLPPGAWWFTDDTEMALGIFEHLALNQKVDQNWLAQTFARRFMAKPERGYGKMARHILREIAMGEDWRTLSSSAFGSGSKGNGSAMRAPIVGAWFHDDLARCATQAKLSSEVTHYHVDAITGAMAVALTTALLFNASNLTGEALSQHIFSSMLPYLPESDTRNALERLSSEAIDKSVIRIAESYGVGEGVLASDTVPFCIWNAIRCADNYPEAIISTIECGGDCDTTAAIVGGMLGARVGVNALPEIWQKRREPLIYQVPPSPKSY